MNEYKIESIGWNHGFHGGGPASQTSARRSSYKDGGYKSAMQQLSIHLAANRLRVCSGELDHAPMKHLLLVLLLAVTAASALADTPEAILKDYRKAAQQAVARLNQSLEKTTTPMITKLVVSGDTAGAELLTSQMKAKMMGEPVSEPQASAVDLFALYDDARAKALAPVQKASIARIDSLLKTAGGAKLETVTELGKVREEIEQAKMLAIASDMEKKLYKTKWTWGYAIEGSNNTITFGAGKTLQVNNDPPHKWMEAGILKIKCDDESIMTFEPVFKTFQVVMAKGGGIRRGKLIDAGAK